MYPHFSYIQLANKAVAPEPRAGLMDQPTFFPSRLCLLRHFSFCSPLF